MDQPDPAAERAHTPLVGGGPFHIGLRYLARKWLAYLAMAGVALSVGTIIVVMSVFSGFRLDMTAAIRGYLSDLNVRPASGGQHDLTDWQSWRKQVLQVEHVEGVAPFIEGFALVSVRGAGSLSPVMFRGIDPDLEPDVSKLGHYLQVGNLADLRRTYVDPRRPGSGGMPACFVGTLFPGFSPPYAIYDARTLRKRPGRLVLVTATDSLDMRLKAYAVNGAFETTNVEYDSKFVVMDLAAAMDLAGSGGAVTGLNVRLDDYANAESVRKALQTRLAPGAELRAYGRGEDRFVRLAPSADGTRLAGLTREGRVVIWETSTGDEAARLGPWEAAPRDVALGPEGRRLAVGFADGSPAVFQVATRKEVLRGPARDAAVSAVAFSPDGFLVAVGYEDGHVEAFDSDDGEQYVSGSAGGSAVALLAFDPLSERLLAADSEGAASVWDAGGGAEIARLAPTSPAPITAAAFSSDGKQVATGDASGRGILWDVGAASIVLAWPVGQRPVRAIAFAARPGEVITGGRSDVRSWVQVVQPKGTLMGSRSAVRLAAEAGGEVEFTRDARRLFLVDAGGRPRLFYCGPRFLVKTWEDEQRTLLAAVAMESFLQGLIMSLILIVAEFFIFALLTTIVNERRRDIGILKAIGYTRRQICVAFLLVGMAIGAGGGLLGAAGGMLFSRHINSIRLFIRSLTGFDPFPADIYYLTKIPSHVDAMTVAVTAGGAILCSLLFSLIPALRAARLDPVQTLHFE